MNTFENQSLLKSSVEKTISPSETKSTRSHEEETSVLGSADWFGSLLRDELEGCVSIAEAKQRMGQILEGFDTNFGEKAKGFTKPAQSLEVDDTATMDGYIASVSKALEKSFSERYTLEELEEEERQYILSYDSNFEVNRIVYYQMDPGEKEMHISLHNAKSIPFREVLNGFNDGLREIARQLKEDPALSSIDKIAVRSWIIEKHPKMAERYGFLLDGIDSAFTSREDFIKRYGS